VIESHCTTRHGRQPADSVFHDLAAEVSDDHGWHLRTNHGQDWPTCGYCGSVAPDALLQLRDAGRIAHVDRSVDWKYGWPHKIYVDVKNLRPDELHVISAITFEPREGERDQWTAVADEQREHLKRDGWSGSDYLYVRYATRPTIHAKYYLIHGLDEGLTDEERETLARFTGYWIESAGTDTFRWRAYDYSCSA
jgi:hypothetical protein